MANFSSHINVTTRRGACNNNKQHNLTSHRNMTTTQQQEEDLISFEPIAPRPQEDNAIVPHQQPVEAIKTQSSIYQTAFEVDFLGKRNKKSKQQITWTFVKDNEPHIGRYHFASRKRVSSHCRTQLTLSSSFFFSHVDLEHKHWQSTSSFGWRTSGFFSPQGLQHYSSQDGA